MDAGKRLAGVRVLDPPSQARSYGGMEAALEAALTQMAALGARLG